jgi:GT2 family glycosyltransferase
VTSVTAVVVTYNRKELLRECLAALAAQSRPVDRVLVVDNASTDGTADLLAQERGRSPFLHVLTLPDNQGGAGGFHEGMKRAHAEGADWVWLMDDDTLPRPDALERLLAALESEPDALVLGSKVIWNDGRMHPMNMPGFERNRPARVVDVVEKGLLPLRTATFVSLLVKRDAIDRYGLPFKQYFIWSDDIEYTARITRHEDAAYLVPDSLAHHKTKQPYTAVSTSGGRFYFHIRNHVFMLRGSAWDAREKLTLVYVMLFTSLQYLRHNGFALWNVRVILRALRDGVTAPRPA